MGTSKERLVDIYMQIHSTECGTLQDVADELDMKITSLRVRCSQLRAEGVQLPYFPKESGPSIDDLNSIILRCEKNN